jgi:thiamine biosynthesis lipoprotein
MRKDELKKTFNRSVDRRRFLRACGALGLGAIAGGVIRNNWDVVGIGRRLKKVRCTRVAMGTFVSITAVHESRDLAQEAIGGAHEEMARLIAIFNRYDAASPVSVLNRDGRLEGPPAELSDVLRWAEHFHRISGGTFDVTVKPLLDLFDATVGRDGHSYPSDEQIAEALSRVDAAGVGVEGRAVAFAKPGMGVTLDGIAKGYIVDMMSASMLRCGVENHLIDAGGDIRTAGTSAAGAPWTIAVQDPKKHRNYPDVIRMNNGAVATSGNYEIYYDSDKVYHHVVDPHTGRSPAYSSSVTVRATSVMVADALATAAFAADPRTGMRMLEATRSIYGTRALILSPGGSGLKTEGWEA